MILLKPVHYEKIAPCSMPPWACLLCSSVLRGETKSSQSQRSLVWPVLQLCTSLRSLNPWINPWMNPWMIRKCRIGLKMNPWYMLEWLEYWNDTWYNRLSSLSCPEPQTKWTPEAAQCSQMRSTGSGKAAQIGLGAWIRSQRLRHLYQHDMIPSGYLT
jgi:hypothetical protein